MELTFHWPVIRITLIGLVGIDDNIKIDLIGKREESVFGHGDKHSGCVIDIDNS
jgi:hypothetical protein